MSRALDDLSPRFKPLAMELLASCVEARIPVVIVDTLRTAEEHAANLAKGVSWTQHSKHLTGDAIDICLVATYDEHGGNKLNWNVNDPAWARLAAIGRSLGLRCGYDWTVKDAGHFEYVAPAAPVSHA